MPQRSAMAGPQRQPRPHGPVRHSSAQQGTAKNRTERPGPARPGRPAAAPAPGRASRHSAVPPDPSRTPRGPPRAPARTRSARSARQRQRQRQRQRRRRRRRGRSPTDAHGSPPHRAHRTPLSASPQPGAARMQALSRKRPRPGPTHARSSRAALAPLPAVLGAPRAGARLRGGHWLRAAPPRASGSSGSSGPCGDGRAGTASPGPRAARVRAVRSPLTAGPARCVAAGSAWHRADRPPVEPAAEDERRHDEDRDDDDDDDEDEDDDDEDEEERSLRTALQELRVDAARCERTAGGPAGLSRHGRSGSPVLYPPTFTHCGTKHKTRSHTPKTHVRSSVCATAEHGTEDRHSPHFEASHGRRATAEPLLNHRCGACGEVTGELPRSALIVSL
ncbi:sterile alpha motif domain-containing protein 1-like isoform X2 [Gallus gallus]|uniref:sterile alpha motif domain-containing protein 1-like isoform X2 n=1 Tax=Gallus gallus TaxID=9031 RepID=UPI001AE1C74A|nr:sterile alpha motif domain-containing protein 1-like isoform X2 [Gallus gallus]